MRIVNYFKEKKMNYKMIIFDADDTLFDFSKAEEYAFRKAMEESNLVFEVKHLVIYKEINIAIWREFENGLITQKELKVDRFRRFLNKINETKDAYTFAESFMNNLEQASFLFEGAEELVEKLFETHRLIMVTNGLTRVQRTRVRKSIIAKYFEEIIISEEIGYAKPNPMIFEIGLKDIALPNKSEIIIIGDSLTSDIPGGIKYGIDTAWYNPDNHINDKGIKPTYEIKKLDEIHSIK